MSEEEKKEYEELKSLLYRETIKRKLLDIIEKQSKEIEELKQDNKKLDKENQSLFESYNFNDTNLLVKLLKEYRKEIKVLKEEKEYLNCIIESDKDNYINKDKIKAKIEELIKEGNYRTADNPNGRVHFQKEITDYQIEDLQSLLNEE